jgi:hypothetical protein
MRSEQAEPTRWNLRHIAWPYILLFPLCYLAGYFRPSACLPISLLIIAYSYWLIVIHKAIEPVILLAIFARAIVGFSANGNSSLYTTFNVLVNYLPIVILILSTLSQSTNFATASRRTPYTFLYVGILIFYFAIGLPKSTEMLGLRVIPMILILLFLCHSPRQFDNQSILLSFRLSLLCAIAMALSPSYLELSLDRLQQGMVFGQESDFLPLLGILPRAMGPWWDPRIMGIFCAVYMCLALVSPLLSPPCLEAQLSRC